MRARVYDKSRDCYYISEVYGIVNRAGDWYIVDDSVDPNRVVLVSYLDFDSKPPYKVNIEIIDANPFPKKNWIYLDKMNDVNALLKQSKKLHYFRGMNCIWETQNALAELLDTNTIEKSALQLTALSTKLDGWNYIESQSDIDKLMEEYHGFHDSVLKELSYVSGDYYDKEKHGTHLSAAGSKQIRILFDSEWEGQIEIIMLAPRIVHLIPGEENFLSILYDASIFIQNRMVHFYDSYTEEIPNEYTGTYFVAMGMMWRHTES